MTGAPVAAPVRPITTAWRRAALLALAVTVAAPTPLSARTPTGSAGEERVLAPFSTAAPGEPPQAWVERTLADIAPNRWQIVAAEGAHVLEARSSRSASSLAHAVPGPVADASRLDWRWWTERFPRGGAFGAKASDDFPARVYVLFDYPLHKLPLPQRVAVRLARALHGEDVPAAALCYVWDAAAPTETLAESPYTSRVRMIVASSGAAGRWATVSRDIAADFQRAFGAEHGPGMPPIRAIVVGADSDQTGDTLLTRFGDLRLGRPAAR